MSRLLLVDDEQDIRYLFKAELEESGYEVDTASGAQEAAQKLQEKKFDLLILDIQMPGESGLELLQQVVKEQQSLPVILCTAYSCYKEDFSSWLADAYVVKSSDLTQLKEEVERLLQQGQKPQTP